MKVIFLLVTAFIFDNCCIAQQPRYTPKKFVNSLDTSEFKYIISKESGFNRTFVLTRATYYDLDDDSTTYMKFTDSVLICIEGEVKNRKRNGIYTFSLFDLNNHSKKYKIWEQTFKDDQLNGPWRTYTLRGVIVSIDMYKKNLPNGLSRTFWIDGKTLMEETEYLADPANYVTRTYYDNQILKSEISYIQGKLNGVCKKYYDNGKIQEYAEFKDDDFHGIRKYFYDNGQIWIEQTYKNGKYLDVIANYTKDGIKRNPGTLKNGNGTIIFYDEDGSIRETQTFVNGNLSK